MGRYAHKNAHRPREETRLDEPNPPSFEKLAHAREWRHYPAAPESSGHIPNGPACDAGDPTTPNGFLAPHDARTGSIRPGSRLRAPKRHCPVRARHGALSSPRFPLCDPGVAAVPWRRAARCSQLLRTRRRSVAIHSTWKAAVRTAVDLNGEWTARNCRTAVHGQHAQLEEDNKRHFRTAGESRARARKPATAGLVSARAAVASVQKSNDWIPGPRRMAAVLGASRGACSQIFGREPLLCLQLFTLTSKTQTRGQSKLKCPSRHGAHAAARSGMRWKDTKEAPECG